MSLFAAVGQARDLDGREAGAKAARQALDRLGGSSVVLGIVAASQSYPAQHVLTGAASMLGNTPLIGFSTSAEISNIGYAQRSVVIALLAGKEVQAHADWWSGFADDSRSTTKKMLTAAHLDSDFQGTLMLVADGLTGEGMNLCKNLPHGKYTLLGGLSGGDFYRGRTWQIGGNQAGYGGLAAAWLTGKIAVGVGMAHGWQPVGSLLEVTHARGPWIRTLDNKPVSEVYANLLGYEARNWSFPPLSHLARLYPLGIENKQSQDLLVRAPLKIETDGSMRLNARIEEGSMGYLLVGSPNACLEATRKATRAALAQLGNARPIMALVLVDISWQMLFEGRMEREFNEIRSILGGNLPIAGGYTLGQIGQEANAQAQLFNQHIQITLFGDPG